MNPEILAALARHALTLAGGVGLATSGVDVAAGTASGSDDITTIVGAAMTLFGLVWSFYQKRQAQKKLDDAAKAP